MSYSIYCFVQITDCLTENFSISFNTVILNANLEEDETFEMISLPA